MEQTKKSLFYAYPGKPSHIAESIEGLAKHVNDVDDAIEIITWRNLRNSGIPLFDPIQEQISSCSAFCCDLTYLNDNVLFELGYALALNKPIFISLNTSIEESKEKYAKFRLLENIGYSGYANQHDLHSKLFHESPWNSSKGRSQAIPVKQQRVFHAKLPVPTDTANAIDTVITGLRQTAIEIRADDQQEAPFQSLDWYREQISSSIAVVIHRLGNELAGPEDHNYRCALLAGMACGYGLGSMTLVLSQEPSTIPLDFKDVFKTYSTAKAASELVQTWINTVKPILRETSTRRERRQGQLRSAETLRHISFGQNVAENERGEINEYLIETGPFQSALSRSR